MVRQTLLYKSATSFEVYEPIAGPSCTTGLDIIDTHVQTVRYRLMLQATSSGHVDEC
jgi:hypothetical protein